MSQEKIDLTIKICENLPFNITTLEKNGCCQKKDANCKYNRSNLYSDLQLCSKKTYTPSMPSIRIAV